MAASTDESRSAPSPAFETLEDGSLVAGIIRFERDRIVRDPSDPKPVTFRVASFRRILVVNARASEHLGREMTWGIGLMMVGIMSALGGSTGLFGVAVAAVGVWVLWHSMKDRTQVLLGGETFTTRVLLGVELDDEQLRPLNDALHDWLGYP